MDVFDLFAKLTLDTSEYEGGLNNAVDSAEKGGSGIGKALGTAAKVGAAAIGAAATAAGAIVKQAVDNYSEYEQLVGGVETLFKTSADTVMSYASQAYQTAGLSANEYMETVTSFSASLLQSLGGDTEAAAQYADMAITDISDNANKMGTDMAAIQNAYQGFAKQNYTMLDNLKLGYGGTKTEMERLILDAEKLDSSFKATRDENGNLAMSYADIVDAIHIVQDEMGITGTTASEASTTIQGSLTSMKAAWTNLVTGLADDNADIGKLIDDLVTSIIGENGEGGVINNILPAIERSLEGIMKLVSTVVPTIVPLIVDIVVDNLPLLIEAGVQILTALIGGLAEALPQLVAAIPDIIMAIVNGLVAAWPDLKAAGMDLLTQIADGIVSNVSDLWNKIIDIGSNIKDAFWEVIEAAKTWGIDLIANFINGISEKVGDLWDGLRSVGRGIRDFIGFSEPKKGPLSDFHTYAPDMMDLFAKGIRDNEGMLKDTVADAFDFGSMTVSSANQAPKRSANGIREEPITIIVQSVLDGKVIGETATKWQRRQARAFG